MSRHALAICIIGLLAGLLPDAGVIKPVRDSLLELRFSAASRPPTGEIVLVEIDAKSIAEIGAWPWPRRIHAELIRSIDRLDPSEIAIDIDFSTPSNEVDDSALEAALREARSTVILAAFNQKWAAGLKDDSIIANRPLERFRAHAWLAGVNIEPDSDGSVRRYPFGHVIAGEVLPSVAALYGGAPPSTSSFLIDFGIAAREIDRISIVDLLRGRIESRRLQGKKIIIGASAIELRDFFQVPNHGFVPGSLLQVIGAETIMQGRVLKETDRAVTAGGLALMVILMLAVRRLRWHIVLLGLVFAAILLEAAAFVLQVWRPIVLDTAAWHIAFLGFAGLTIGQEIDLRRILLVIANTERHHAEAVLDQVILDSFEGIVVADGEGTIQAVSRAAAKILKPRERRNWKGRLVKDLVPAELTIAMREAVSACSQGLWEGGELREMTLHAVGSGERVIEYMVTPSRLFGGPTMDGAASADRFVVCLSFRDVTDRRLAEKRLDYLARYDTLTGLPNRNHFMETLGCLLERKGSGAVLYFDLDRFKNVNDTFGHGMGDELLRAVARRSLELLPSPHVLARFGGDEFAALWMGPVDVNEVELLAQQLIEHLSDPYQVGGAQLTVGASVGIVIIGEVERDPAILMRNVDTALYRAKKAGGGSHCIYEASMGAALQARQKLEVELWDALARQNFQVFYQPQFELAGGGLIGVEALLRWRHPERGFVPPDEFIPVAEEIGLMDSLGEWVLQRACEEVARWPGTVRLAVNVSPAQFMRGDMATIVTKALARSGLPAERLELEITESLFIQENAFIRAVMNKLRSLGITFALDDFGTGYSSLSYLRKFPIDTIKIDRSFVLGVPHDRESMAILQAVAALAASLDLRIVAEGLETQEQIEVLRRLGCHKGQGYGLGRPQPGEEIVGLLA